MVLWLFSLLAVVSAVAHGRCGDLPTPIDLKDDVPTFIWDSKSRVFSFKEGHELPRITLAKVKFKNEPRTETLKGAINGAFELEIGSLWLSRINEGSFLSDRQIFYSINIDRATSSGMPSMVTQISDGFTSSIRQESETVFILTSELKRSSTTAYQARLKIKGTEIVNIELLHPVYIQYRDAKGKLRYDNLGSNETLCVESWSGFSLKR